MTPPPFVAVSAPRAERRSVRGAKATTILTQSAPTLRLEHLKLLNPELAAAAQRQSPRLGLPRSQVTSPVAPSQKVQDQVLFEAADDPARKLYLPRYRLGEEEVSGERRYRIRLDEEGEGWSLTLYLERFPAPEIEIAARDAQEIPHEVAVLLRYQLRHGEAEVGEKELAFDDLTPQGAGLRAVLRFSRLEERDQLYEALTQPSYGATLVVRRALRAAVPLEPQEDGAYVASAGRAVLKPSMPLELDAARDGEETADIALEQGSKGLAIAPRGGARLASLGKADFNGVGFAELRKLRYSDAALELAQPLDESSLLMITSNWNPGGRRGVYNDHPTGVLSVRRGWGIINQDRKSLPENAAFNVLAMGESRRSFVHRSEAGNVSGNSTFIDHPLTNGKHDALLLVTPRSEPTSGRWTLELRGFRDRNAVIEVIKAVRETTGMGLKEAKAAVEAGVIQEDLSKEEARRIGAAVQRAGGQVRLRQSDSSSSNPHHIGVWYEARRQRWAIFNQDMAAMPAGVAFNVLVLAAGRDTFVHRAASGNSSGNVTWIDHPLTNGKPDALLVVTPNWNPPGSRSRPVVARPPERPVLTTVTPITTTTTVVRSGVYNDHAIGVYYTRGKWAIYNQDRQPMPDGAAFNVHVAGSDEQAFLHRSTPDNTKGYATWLAASPGVGRLEKGLAFAVQTGQDNRVKVEVAKVMDDGLAIQWVGYSDQPRYREQEWTLDDAGERQPFVFPPDLYPYVFPGVEGPPSGKAGLIRHSVRWGSTPHVYYQDEARRERFYYLPDAFKIARTEGPVRGPFMEIRFGSADGSLDQMTVGLSYLALPWADGDRLEHAAGELAGSLPEGSGEPLLEPLLANRLRFRLGLPRSDSASVSFVEQGEALVSLRDGIQHSLSLSMQDFQAVFDAMMGGLSLLFKGQVEIDLGEEADESIPPVPFQARMDDLAGEELAVNGSFDEPSGKFQATLHNAIESPVRIRNLAVELVRGEAVAPAALQGLDLPFELAPGSEAAFEATSALPGEGGQVRAHVDLREVEVLPDREAILNAVIDPTTRADYVRTIRVRTVRELFEPPAEDDQRPISLILVELKRGEAPTVTVELRADQLTVEARLKAPIRDYLLGREDQGLYSYRVTPVRGGEPAADREWKTASEEDLWILSTHVA